MKHLLKQLRSDLGLSQTQFANATNAAQPTVSNWERGDRIPTREQMRSIIGLIEDSEAAANLAITWIKQ